MRGTLKPGAPADIALIDLDEPWIVVKDKLLSRSKNTPFEDARFSGRAVATYVAGQVSSHALIMKTDNEEDWHGPGQVGCHLMTWQIALPIALIAAASAICSARSRSA